MVIEKRLENNIPVLIEEDNNISSGTIGIYVDTGSKYESKREEGVSHLLEHMMFKGTKTRDAKEILTSISNDGSMINAFTNEEVTCYYIQSMYNKLVDGIDILNDMFINSTFTVENLEKEKKVVLEEIKMYLDMPDDVVHEENSKFAFRGPQSRPVLGTSKSVNGITREILVDYFKRRYRPSNIVVSICGKVDVEEVIKKLNEGIGQITECEDNTSYSGEFEIHTGEKPIKKDTNQVHLCVNTMGISSLDKRKYKVAILSNVLGGNMSSRLFQNIREDKGLAYSIYSYMTSYREGGLFSVYAGTTKEKYQEVIDDIKREFKLLKEGGITNEELKKSKNQFLSGLTFGLENSKSRMNRMANSYLLYGRIRDIDEVIKEIEEITLEEINEVARDIFDEKNYSHTVLGDIN